MSCFQHFGSDQEWGHTPHSFFGMRRMAWKKGVGELTLRELEEYRATKRVEGQQETEAEAFGEDFRKEFDLAESPQLVARILGIRRDLEHIVPHLVDKSKIPRSGDAKKTPHLVDVGTRASLEDLVSRDQEVLKKNPKFKPGKSFFKEVGSLCDPDCFKSDAEKAVENIWGPSKTMEGKRIYSATAVWKDLTPSQQSIVRAHLNDANIESLSHVRRARGFTRTISQLANATAEQLKKLRAEAKRGDDYIFPQPLKTKSPEQYAKSPSKLDRLIQLRKTESQMFEQTGSTSKYDPERLQDFLDELQGSDSGEKNYSRIESILEDHLLLGLRNDPALKESLSKLRLWHKVLDPKTFSKRLETILKRSPAVEIPTEESSAEETNEEGEEEKKKTAQQQGLGKEILRLRDQLEENYIAARALGSELADRQSRYNEARDLLKDADPKNKPDVGFRDIQKQLGESGNKKTELLRKIYKLESSYKRKINELYGLLEGSDEATEFKSFQGAGVPSSSEKTLFSSNTSSFEEVVKNLNQAKLLEVGSARKQRLSSAQFLFQLNLEEEMGGKNLRVTETQLNTAMQKTLAGIARASNVEMDRAQTRELSEKIGATGWETFKKVFVARWTEGKVYTLQDILGGITQKGSELQQFSALSPYMTDDELHVWLDENPEEETEGLKLYIEKIKDCLKGFRHDGGSVELLDQDAVPLANFVRRLENIVAVRRGHASKFTEKFEPGKDAMSQATVAVKEVVEAEKEEKEGVFDKLKDKVKSIGRWINKNILRREKQDIVEEIKSKKMNKEDAKSLLESKGLAGVAGIGAAASAAVEIAEKGSWAKRGWRGAKAAPRAVRRGGGRFLGGAGTFLKYGTAPVWWPLKQGWRGAKWTGGKLGGGVKWAGSKVAKFWKWI